jgi:hypothetical protein
MEVIHSNLESFLALADKWGTKPGYFQARKSGTTFYVTAVFKIRGDRTTHRLQIIFESKSDLDLLRARGFIPVLHVAR